MVSVILFIFGVAIGSFINVLSLRYKDGGSIFFTKKIQGRSHCPHCTKVLQWYELLPLLSFVIQRGRCRGCKTPLSWQYPAVELITGLLTAALPIVLYHHMGGPMLLAQGNIGWLYAAIATWLLITYTSITLSAIDLRLQIIPDQSNVLLGILGITLIAFKQTGLLSYPYFTGSYGSALGAISSPLISSLVAAAAGLIIFGGIVLLTRGRGMGLGDVKLAIPIGLILGWPDAIVAFAAAFVVGAISGILLIARRKATMKAAVPFGPFLVIGLFVTIFYGEKILRWYFSLI
jgi:prepilin signal peptidase PulO-like enzyme (type II secretory pathway)